jgi:hypothetical protein
MSTYKKDDAVKIKFTLLSGVISGALIDNTTFEVQYLVTYTDNHGEQQERAFYADQLEAA